MQIERWNDASPPTAARVRQELEREGYSVSQWSDAPGT